VQNCSKSSISSCTAQYVLTPDHCDVIHCRSSQAPLSQLWLVSGFVSDSHWWSGMMIFRSPRRTMHTTSLYCVPTSHVLSHCNETTIISSARTRVCRSTGICPQSAKKYLPALSTSYAEWSKYCFGLFVCACVSVGQKNWKRIRGNTYTVSWSSGS